ncbi:MAG TPA: acetate--CoA ligase [Methanothrix sp.]|nr:acetate--CoA ligase [Methanothrix sp.]HOV82316.1 acetate--CoA ligase [Methanothrix sp.]HPC89721.1 acetate--CoA ligase [Methanothrix sp.]HQE87456.1 acetate--CoA ligase [Methanothrix sp.]HRS85155.1 acetate--CoA ligase [Methanothrix sp.]
MDEAKSDKSAQTANQGLYYPPRDLVENSNVMAWMKQKGLKTESEMRQWCSANYVQFWDEMAKTYADWFEPYKQTLQWKAPFAKWFIGGKINAAYNAVDRHAKSWRRNKLAYIFVGEPVGDVRKITYYELAREVNRFANALKAQGIKKGDRVGIYLPMIPELPVAMLACAKIGAVHVVVFSGFSAVAVRDRLEDCQPRLLVTCDGSYRRGKPIATKPQADEAIAGLDCIEKVVVVKRNGQETAMKDGRDVWWDDFVAGQAADCETLPMDSSDPLFILYTAGAAGKPRGIVHTHGGMCVGPAFTTSWVFDIKDTDVYWSTADIGWITGHSYIAYGPLCLGATSIMYEGSPDYPDFGRWFKIIEDYGVSVIYTAPTAIRMFMNEGPSWPQRYDLSTVRLMGSVGEAMNPDAFIWWRRYVGGGFAPIMDTWFQSETGSQVIAPLPITPLKPGSPSFPLPGYNVQVVDDSGLPVPAGMTGNIVITEPWPSMLREVYRDPARYSETYWSAFPGRYHSGDKARVDEDGYIWALGRGDDVLKVAGHRISNAEVEASAEKHPSVAAAAVIGKPDRVKGESIVVYAVLKPGIKGDAALEKDIKNFVRKTLGPIAIPSDVIFVSDIPRDKAGKPVRPLIKARALGEGLGDTSAVANPVALDAITPIAKK